MWLTDRSRQEAAHQCRMKRYLTYHAGPYGYGWVRTAQAMPLATGTAVHAILAEALTRLRTEPKALQDRPWLRSVVKRHSDAYESLIASRGFLGASERDSAEFTMKEQSALIQGLAWGWLRSQAQPLLDEFEVIDVEREELYIVGAAVKDPIGQQSRPDFIARRRADGKLGIHDFKTMASLADDTVEEYRQSVQMAVGTLGAEARLGEPVDHYYVHGLLKGSRRPEWEDSTGAYTGPKRQASVLCYGYHKPANPPLEEESWKPHWKSKDSAGKQHTLGKAYSKKHIWDAWDPEAWVDQLSLPDLYALFVRIGPYERQTHMIRQYLRGLEPEEQRWLGTLWALYPTYEKHGWGSREFQDALDAEIPRSYNCFPFRGRCPHWDICFKQPGWQDPTGPGGKYTHRRPHHEGELNEMRSRGIPVPEDLEEVPEIG